MSAIVLVDMVSSGLSETERIWAPV